LTIGNLVIGHRSSRLRTELIGSSAVASGAFRFPLQIADYQIADDIDFGTVPAFTVGN
jgi:hypothetical protein